MDGNLWKTAEHAYQAAKTNDFQERLKIKNAKGPGEAKRLGRMCKVRKDWEEIKLEVMRNILVEKFTQNPEILEKLKATGDSPLIEGNTWHDNFWGDCFCEKCTQKVGRNALGNLLMWLREAY